MDNEQFNPSSATNYTRSYKRVGFILPPIKFRQIPSIQLEEVPKLPPRKFPIEPRGPCRRWEKFAGFQEELPNLSLLADKPIVRAPPPQDIRLRASDSSQGTTGELPVLKNINSEVNEDSYQEEDIREEDESSDDKETRLTALLKERVDELCKSYQWSTTKERATAGAHLPVKEVPLPTSTIEENADAVMLRPKRFEARPDQWQQLTTSWDRFQTREFIGEPVGKIGSRGLPSLDESGPRHVPSKRPSSRSRGNISIEEGIERLGHDVEFSTTFVRQCPGYAGFVPRSPLRDAPMVRMPNLDRYMTSTMSAGYRRLPLSTQRDFHHKGPLSRTVTLTYPYNPYNKVENFAYFRKDMGSNW